MSSHLTSSDPTELPDYSGNMENATSNSYTWQSSWAPTLFKLQNMFLPTEHQEKKHQSSGSFSVKHNASMSPTEKGLALPHDPSGVVSRPAHRLSTLQEA